MSATIGLLLVAIAAAVTAACHSIGLACSHRGFRAYRLELCCAALGNLLAAAACAVAIAALRR